MDKNLYEANVKLLDANKQLLKDIKYLIAYTKGNKDLKEKVTEIIEYYENKVNKENK